MLLFKRSLAYPNTRRCSKPLKSSFIRSTRVAYNTSTQDKNLDVTHAHFLAEASPKAKWTDSGEVNEEKATASADDLEGVTEERGKLSPTTSHLFKLILPLAPLARDLAGRARVRRSTSTTPTTPDSDTTTSIASAHAGPPTVFLLHPAQPLSHIGRLIISVLGPNVRGVSFRSAPEERAVQWADSTDLGNFIRSAARAAAFTISITHNPVTHGRRKAIRKSERSGGTTAGTKDVEAIETNLTISVPTFADRTHFLQRRLRLVGARLQTMEGLKDLCDTEARHGARQMALGGLGILVVYWGAVARLTFWDFGWDVMEPITYLSGLSTVVLGYLWFLYQGREVSYTSVLARSISARRQALYKARGFDIDRWMELLNEKKTLRAEISRIARDYEEEDRDSENHIEDPAERHALAEAGSPHLKSDGVLEEELEREKKQFRKSALDAT